MATNVIDAAVVPEITVFVRHSPACKHLGKSFHKGCSCRKHLRWTYGGKQYTKPARTRIWSQAEAAKRREEDRYKAAGPSVPGVATESKPLQTIERALELFLSDKGSQGIEPEVLKKYERELGRFAAFLAQRSHLFPHEITTEDITDFRAGWAKQYPSSATRAKVQERLRAFLRYCYEARLIDRVPVLSPIRVSEKPTIPLTDEQYDRLLEIIPETFASDKAVRVRAIVRLMRHSGLAIQDAVTLERGEFLWDADAGVHRVVVDRQKTGVHVSVVIPPSVAREVTAAMQLNSSSRYVFWNTGTGKAISTVTNWQHDLREAFRAADMPEGHPHQLRDTFAVSLFNKGTAMEDVSKLLGHKSTRVTEKHYSPWIKSRQDRLDRVAIEAWDEPVAKKARPTVRPR